MCVSLTHESHTRGVEFDSDRACSCFSFSGVARDSGRASTSSDSDEGAACCAGDLSASVSVSRWGSVYWVYVVDTCRGFGAKFEDCSRGLDLETIGCDVTVCCDKVASGVRSLCKTYVDCLN